MLLGIKWSNIECFLVKLTGIYSKLKNTVTAVVSEEKYCDTVSVVAGEGGSKQYCVSLTEFIIWTGHNLTIRKINADIPSSGPLWRPRTNAQTSGFSPVQVANRYLLLTEFEGCTVSYGPCYIHFN